MDLISSPHATLGDGVPSGKALVPKGSALLSWLSAIEPSLRDSSIERALGIAAGDVGQASPGEHLVGYHASGVSAIVQALREACVTKEDTVVDLGAGLGKVLLISHLLTGARAWGIEIQPELARLGNTAAERLGVSVVIRSGDARQASLEQGTVFFLYAPFTGPALDIVVRRLRTVAEQRAIVVCALGLDLPRTASWLVARPGDAFWLTVYDSVVPGVAPRVDRHSTLRGADATAIVLERRAVP